MKKFILLISFIFSICTSAFSQSYMMVTQYNPGNQGNNSCDTGGMFAFSGNSPFAFTALNGGSSVYTPACLRDPYVRLYFGTYYLLYSEGLTYLDIATASSLTGTWTLLNHISIGSSSAFGVNVPSFTVDPSGIVHVTVWDYPATQYWEIHPSSSNPSTWGSSWSSRANIFDITSTAIPGVENLYLAQYNSTYYMLQSNNSALQLRTSSNVTTGWSAPSSNLSVPSIPAFVEAENPLIIGNNLAVSWAYDDDATHVNPLSFSLNSNGASGSWGSPIQVTPTVTYGQITPTTDMACGTAAQYYQAPSFIAPSSNLCAVGSASSVTSNGTTWNWTCTLSSNVAQCSAAQALQQISNATIKNATIF